MTHKATTPIQEFYRDKCVLITGGSGFMGKILLEKLLRSCPNVGTVYLLMRPKRGEGTAQRVEKLMQEPVSDFTLCLRLVYFSCCNV
jgi:fatty acyl-CoA reductase